MVLGFPWGTLWNILGIVIGNWSPGIGDPTFLGWFTVGLYFLAAARAYGVGARLCLSTGSERIFWRSVGLGLIVLGVNKQLDLQSALTEIGRILAARQGWYEDRRTVQTWFIAGFLSFAVVFAGAGWYWLRRGLRSTRVAACGVGILLTFVVVRAASFHNVDLFLGRSVAGVRWNGILEIGGLILILGASVVRARRVPATRAGSVVTVVRERALRRER